ncbi:hypothetical protein [Streptomyces carpinensis]|uniref:Integral membrane protein n=1 Tax=Streptomyces carpinensis TaxID=66369 RepID=A0ABV1VXM5_9ACTN|nr:hypothetical protein [Streptomyces carpinensis]
MLVGFAVSVVCAVGALIALCGVLSIALPGRPQPWAVPLMQRGALMTGSAAAAVYAWGFFVVALSEHEFGNGADSIPAPACRDGFPRETVQRLSHHRPSYLPLRFDCVLDDGTTYSSDPSYAWLNGTSLALALSALALVIGAGYVTEFGTRKKAG